MIINLKTHEISRDTYKLETTILKKKVGNITNLITL